MTNAEFSRQKKLERKRQKRKEKKRKASMMDSGLMTISPAKASEAPVYECIVPDSTFEVGIGNLMFSRSLGGGRLAVSVFLVDIYCLGVKDALYTISAEPQYAHQLSRMDDVGLQRVDPCCFRKLVEGAVAYASDLGFEPHRDYARAKRIFGDVDAAGCPESFQYGDRGKPHYVRGPSESESDAKRIIEQLRRRVGEGNYHFTVQLG